MLISITHSLKKVISLIINTPFALLPDCVVCNFSKMSERPKSSAASSKENYNHQELSNEMEKLNSQFEEMKEALICLNVRAHKLEADIAQMFNPCLAESLHKLELNCESCTAAINASM